MADATATKTAAKKTAPAAKKAAAPKAPKPDKFCLHGCGTKTKGGDFVIGHDAKLKSILQKAHVASPDKGVDLGGKSATPLHGQTPMEIAKVRGWEGFLDKAKAIADAKASKPKRERKVKGVKPGIGDQVEVQYRGSKRSGLVTEVKGERAKVDLDMGEGKTESRPFAFESITTVKKAAPVAEATA